MNRLAEFEEIKRNNAAHFNCNDSDKLDDQKEAVFQVRNRQKPKSNHDQAEKVQSEHEHGDQYLPFFQSFLAECNLLNSTALQLSKQLRNIISKPEQLSFSHSSNKASPVASIEEALNICSATINLLAENLARKEEEIGNGAQQRHHGGIWSTLFTKITVPTSAVAANSVDPLLQHYRLVLEFLNGRIGRITEDLEAFKDRQRARLRMVANVKPTIRVNEGRIMVSGTLKMTADASSTAMQQLQLENSQMLEEQAHQLFSTLATTEVQVLEIARLQAALQSHLTTQHQLTCRLFEESEVTGKETRRGNEYLRKTGQDSSLMRNFMIWLILGLSCLLLLLHYFHN